MLSIRIISLVAFILSLSLLVMGCEAEEQPPSPTTGAAAAAGNLTLVEACVQNSATFRFDGVSGSIQIQPVEGADSADQNAEREYTVGFQTAHPGHGDRSGQVLAQVITRHSAVIRIQGEAVTSAICDGVWDLQSGRSLEPQTQPDSADDSVDDSTESSDNVSAGTPAPIDWPVISEEISWALDNTTVTATLTRPDTAAITDGRDLPARFPAVVLVAGSGPTDRNWNSPLLPGTNGSAALLAGELARHGYVTIRYDKRVTGPFAAANIAALIGRISMESHLDELEGAVDILVARPDVDPAAIFVLGNSEGTIHALNYQSTREPRFAGLILTGMPGRDMADVIHSQLAAQVAALPEADAVMAGFDRLMAAFLAEEPFVADPAVPGWMNDLVQAFYIPVNLPFSRELFSLDPAPLLGRITDPTLVIMAVKDIQVDAVLDSRPLTIAAEGHPNISIVYPENANHVLKYEPRPLTELSSADTQTYNSEDRFLDPETLSFILDWLDSRS